MGLATGGGEKSAGSPGRIKKKVLPDILCPYDPVALDNPVHISRETVTVLHNGKDFMAGKLNTIHRLSSWKDNGESIEFFILFHRTAFKDE